MLADFKLWRIYTPLREANAIIGELNKIIKEEDGKKFSALEALSMVPKIEYLGNYRGKNGAKKFIEEAGGDERSGITNCLKTAFLEEEDVQARFGGIKFPPGVIVNKIEHRIFNYDTVQDTVSKMVEDGRLDCCTAIIVRMKLKEKLHRMSEGIIRMLKYPFKLTETQIITNPNALLQTNTRFLERDINKLQEEKTKAGCGNCGGGRSSARWKPTPAIPRPERTGATLNLTDPR
jgi:hypothetical protein